VDRRIPAIAAPNPGVGREVTVPIASSDVARDMARRRHSIDTYIKSIVDRAPELTPEQRDRLAVILRTGRPDEQPLDAA
jgi:hypothetical protein